MSREYGSRESRPAGEWLPRAPYDSIYAVANVKKDQLVRAGEWWKHLRWTKRAFWKRQRQADRREAHAQNADG